MHGTRGSALHPVAIAMDESTSSARSRSRWALVRVPRRSRPSARRRGNGRPGCRPVAARFTARAAGEERRPSSRAAAAAAASRAALPRARAAAAFGPRARPRPPSRRCRARRVRRRRGRGGAAEDVSEEEFISATSTARPARAHGRARRARAPRDRRGRAARSADEVRARALVIKYWPRRVRGGAGRGAAAGHVAFSIAFCVGNATVPDEDSWGHNFYAASCSPSSRSRASW